MLSIAIVAQNEAHRLGRCLESLAFADEVLVVDGGSTDGTPELAASLGARVVYRTFTGFREQRSFAVEQAHGPWVLSLDADEVVTPALASEIRETLTAPAFTAYRIPRLDYMFGRWVRHGGWYPQYHVQLFRRDSGRWEREVHERWVTGGPMGTLRHPVLHYSHLEVADFIRKLDRYTTIAARERAARGERVTLWRLALEPPAYFAYKYLWQSGFLDGAHGFTLAMLLGHYRFTELAKVRFHGSADQVSPP
ncbi:MAG TPA: glycosyltransferase family 2 protein [Candidatus Saccharimonadales bacterium]|nr:glycosyltransferase family 2 protein [Candidatus Saccharimonadales bacterium]